VDISSHPLIPLAQNTVFHLGIFSLVFWVLNLWGHFEALNDIFFLRLGAQEIAIGFILGPVGMCSYQLYLSNKLSCTPNKDCMQKLHPRKVDISTTPIGAHKPFGVSSSGVRVLDFIYVKNAFGALL
jgi:hypothetical protein